MSHCLDVTERQAVLDSVLINLKELKVVITHEDLLPRVEPIRHFRPPEPVRRVPVVNYHPIVPPRPQPAEPVRFAPVPNYYPVVPPRLQPAEPARRAPNLNFYVIEPPPPPPAEDRRRPRQEKNCVFL